MEMNVLSLRHLMEAETKDDVFTYMTPASDNGCVVVLFKEIYPTIKIMAPELSLFLCMTT